MTVAAAIAISGLKFLAVRRRAETSTSCWMSGAWGDGVVPLRAEFVALDVEACHLGVADLDPLGVAARVEDAVHCQPCRGRGRGNQVRAASESKPPEKRTTSSGTKVVSP